MRKGPNIKPVPRGEPVAETLEAPVLLKLGDKVSTDDISPVRHRGAHLPLQRAGHLGVLLPERRCRRSWRARRRPGAGIIVGGEIYGQGSSREAAVLVAAVPRRARRHRQELRAHPPRQPHQLGHRAARRSTTPPTTTASSATTCCASTGCARRSLAGRRVAGDERAHGRAFRARCVLTPRERDILLAGGLLAPDRRRPERAKMTAHEPAARDPRGLHARRHQPLPRLPRRATCRRRAPSATASCSPRSAAPIRTGASSTGSAAGSRRSRRRASSGPPRLPGRRRGLHLRAGRGDAGPSSTTPATAATARRRSGPFAIDEGLVPRARGRDRRAHPQHQHEEDHRRPRAGDGRRGRGGGRLRAGRRGRARRAHRARLRRPGRRAAPAGSCPPAARATSSTGSSASLRRRDQPHRLRARARTSASPAPRSPQAMDADRALARASSASAWRRPRAWASRAARRRPKIAVVAPPTAFTALDGDAYDGDADRRGRAASSPWATATAPSRSPRRCAWPSPRASRARVVHECSTAPRRADVRLGHPSGVLPLDAACRVPGRPASRRAGHRLPHRPAPDGRLRPGAVKRRARASSVSASDPATCAPSSMPLAWDSDSRRKRLRLPRPSCCQMRNVSTASTPP